MTEKMEGYGVTFITSIKSGLLLQYQPIDTIFNNYLKQ